jgi:hypothetical protein
MNDKKLLELAAKAVGKSTSKYWHNDGIHCGVEYEYTDGPNGWNPLVDDGDALQLVVKLKLAVVYPEDMAVVRVWLGDVDIIDQLLSNNPYTATRRAIVLAAAELGKRMK